jgi:hypothetical protein
MNKPLELQQNKGVNDEPDYGEKTYSAKSGFLTAYPDSFRHLRFLCFTFAVIATTNLLTIRNDKSLH